MRRTRVTVGLAVVGRGSRAVVIAAAPTGLWDRQATTLQRAVASFTA